MVINVYSSLFPAVPWNLLLCIRTSVILLLVSSPSCQLSNHCPICQQWRYNEKRREHTTWLFPSVRKEFNALVCTILVHDWWTVEGWRQLSLLISVYNSLLSVCELELSSSAQVFFCLPCDFPQFPHSAPQPQNRQASLPTWSQSPSPPHWQSRHNGKGKESNLLDLPPPKRVEMLNNVICTIIPYT